MSQFLVPVMPLLFLPRAFFGRRGEVELVVVFPQIHGGEVAAARVEYRRLLHHIAGRILFPLDGQVAAPYAVFGQGALRVGLEIGLVVLDGILVFPLELLAAGQVEEGHAVGVVVSDGVLVGGRAAGRHVDAAVALAHLEGHLAAQLALLAGVGLAVYLAVGLGSIVKFAPGVLLVGNA